jgi:hypothetical protein
VHPDTGLKIDNTRQYTKNSFLKKQKIIFRGEDQNPGSENITTPIDMSKY